MVWHVLYSFTEFMSEFQLGLFWEELGSALHSEVLILSEASCHSQGIN